MREFQKISCRDGETFTIAGMEFIKFPSKDGRTPAVMKNIVFRSRFGDSNDLRSSPILKRLQDEFMPKLFAAIGEENVLTFKTDLTTLDGLKPYEDMESKVSLVTMEFYRKNVAIFDKYNPETWWWLSTPESAQPHGEPEWVLCVSPSGYIGNFHVSNNGIGVRPFYIFDSSIFESFEE